MTPLDESEKVNITLKLWPETIDSFKKLPSYQAGRSIEEVIEAHLNCDATMLRRMKNIDAKKLLRKVEETLKRNRLQRFSVVRGGKDAD